MTDSTPRPRVPDTDRAKVARELATLGPGEDEGTDWLLQHTGLSSAALRPVIDQMLAAGEIVDRWDRQGHLRVRRFRLAAR